MKELVLPSGFIPKKFISDQYEMGIKASQELGAEVAPTEIEARLSALASTPGGLNLIGRELRSPLLREMLYESSARNLAQVYKLSQGESAEFWADVAVPAAQIGVEGLPAQVEIKSDYVRVDTSLYTANPYVRWNQSNLTKFDILSATQQRMKASLMLQEATAWFRLVTYASGLRSGQGNTAGLQGTSAYSQNAPASVLTTITNTITIQQMAVANANFGARLIKGPKKLWVNPSHAADFVLFNNTGNPAVGGGLGYFAPNMTEMLLQKGNTGTFVGAEVYEDIVVPYLNTGVQVDSKNSGAGTENIIGYLLGPSEFVGIIAIRTDLSIETLKDPNRFADVFAGYEVSNLASLNSAICWNSSVSTGTVSFSTSTVTIQVVEQISREDVVSNDEPSETTRRAARPKSGLMI